MEDGHTKIDVKFVDEMVWLTQVQLCELYQISKLNISEHIKPIFEEGEQDEVSVVRKFRTSVESMHFLRLVFANLLEILLLYNMPNKGIKDTTNRGRFLLKKAGDEIHATFMLSIKDCIRI